MAKTVENFAQPIKEKILQFSAHEQEDILQSIVKLVYNLNLMRIITIQRTCFSCKFYEGKSGNHFCNLVQLHLKKSELRLDCPEFSSKID